MKQNTIICISRRFGSGGREVGNVLSQKLGIPVFDKEVIAKVAKESDMSEAFVESHEGNPTYSHIINVPIGRGLGGAEDERIMTPEKLFMFQSQVIKEIVEENGSCIFVGRCADVILEDYENCFKFFIHSPKEERAKKIMEAEDLSWKEARKKIKQMDWERSSYHNYYTKRKWGDPDHYDMILNTAKMGIEKAAETIIKYIGEV